MNQDPELFFPVGQTGPAVFQFEEAKDVCARCVMRARCLDWALVNGTEYGVWGWPHRRRASLPATPFIATVEPMNHVSTPLRGRQGFAGGDRTVRGRLDWLSRCVTPGSSRAGLAVFGEQRQAARRCADVVDATSPIMWARRPLPRLDEQGRCGLRDQYGQDDGHGPGDGHGADYEQGNHRGHDS